MRLAKRVAYVRYVIPGERCVFVARASIAASIRENRASRECNSLAIIIAFYVRCARAKLALPVENNDAAVCVINAHHCVRAI